MMRRMWSLGAILVAISLAAAPARAQAKACNTSGNSSLAAPTDPGWNGWGVTVANARFQTAGAAGLSAVDVPRLKLTWAFGFPGTNEASAQPVVVGGRVYVGSWAGEVYSLDAKTGCLYWVLKTDAVVRAAISLGGSAQSSAAVAYFGDQSANVYAVDAAKGTVLWKVKIDDHPLAKVTGSPTLYNGRLYVPVASGEEGIAATPTYACCTFRGSIVALDAADGRQIWKTYTIPDRPRRTGRTQAGTDRWGPSGAAVWNAPTIDVRQNVLYIGTGNSYSEPAGKASDAIVAFDLDSGHIKWVNQLIEDDTWNTACQPRMRDHSNCPDQDDPDFDFGASPILLELRNGRRILVAGQKSGLVYGLDPDRKGKLVWTARVDRGGTQGGVMWGPAADGDNVYVAISGAMRVGTTSEFDPTAGGGITALNAATGQKVWAALAKPCRETKSCSPAQVAAVTGIPGVVFSGSADGHLRAYSTGDGTIIWDYDAVREFQTVNGVKANGGTFNQGGVAVVSGMVFATSGYNHITGIYPGNVLLAFAVD